MSRFRHKERTGPGLLFVLLVLVVAAVVGARYFGLYPGGGGEPQTPQHSGDTQPPGDTMPPQAPDSMARVLVYHSHATENYSPKASHQRGGEAGDVLEVGKVFVASLEALGIRVIHDTTVHDKPRYSEAFINSKKMVAAVLEQEPQIEMILDIHRDGLEEKPDGFSTVEINGVPAAKILLVVGDSDQDAVDANLAFAERIHQKLEEKYPGLSRGARLFASEYSDQLPGNSVMVVIGDWRGNVIDEAIESARLLAQVVAELLM